MNSCIGISANMPKASKSSYSVCLKFRWRMGPCRRSLPDCPSTLPFSRIDPAPHCIPDVLRCFQTREVRRIQDMTQGGEHRFRPLRLLSYFHSPSWKMKCSGLLQGFTQCPSPVSSPPCRKSALKIVKVCKSPKFKPKGVYPVCKSDPEPKTEP
jgi:hypothetical protein